MAGEPEMVERVARAICRARGLNPDEVTMGSGGYGVNPQGRVTITNEIYQRRWHLSTGEARAAIQAMREPTSWMAERASEDALGVNVYEHTREADEARPREVWRVMIDAALAAEQTDLK